MNYWSTSILHSLSLQSMAAGSAPALLLMSVLVLLCLISALLCYILIVLILKGQKLRAEKQWVNVINPLIQEIVFNEAEEGDMSIPEEVGKLIPVKGFRSVLIGELVKARRNFTGVAGKNLDDFYVKLQLNKDSLKKLKSSYWHLKAQGIQELAIMDQKDAFKQVYPLTLHRNEQVRIEAQVAVVVFSGFEGLSFLDALRFPISQWQQLKLIHELGTANEVPGDALSRWLKSENDSVVVFSIKLVTKYHLYEFHEALVQTLSHSNKAVRLQAIWALKEIYTDETAQQLLFRYPQEDLTNQLAILEVLGTVGTSQEIPFLLEQFRQENHRLKLAAGRAVASIWQGFEPLDQCEVADQYPWNIILKQIKGEQAA